MSGKRTIKPDIEGMVLREYEAGIRSSILSEKYGINRKTITRIVRRNGGVVRDQRSASGRPLISPDSYVEQVIALRNFGLSQERIASRIGMSQMVVSRTLRRAGFPTKRRMAGENSGNWRGGKTITGNGYIAVAVGDDDQMACMKSKQGYVLEHRLVMARHFGRPLRDYETVHHINGDRTDNRLENLQVRFGNHGKGIRLKCACCGSSNLIESELD